MTEIVDLILRAKDQASEAVDRIRGRLEKLEDSAESIRKTSQEMMDFGVKIGAMGAALTATLAVPVKFAADFEQAMAKVRALTGATEEEFARLSKAAKELGLATKFTAEEAAAGMSFLAMAGFKTNEIIAAMPSVLQLAAAANLDLASAADITSNILTGYGMKVEELNRANDVLVKAFTSANTDLTQLGQAMKFVGPVASSAGVAFEETAAAVGLLGNAGIQATMAGTSLRKIITSLIKPVGDAEKMLETLGITVTDQEGKFTGLASIVSQFEKAFKNVGGEAEKTAIIMRIFGDRAGPAMAALIEQGSGALEEFTQKLHESAGIAEEISSVQIKNLKGSITILGSSLAGLLISIGAPFLSALSKVVNIATVIVNKLTEIKEALGPVGTIIFGVVGAVGALLVVVGALSAALGAIGLVVVSLVNGFSAWATIIPQLATGIKSAITVLAGLKTSLIAAAGASGALQLALGAGFVGIAIAAGYAVGKLIDYLIRGRKEMDALAESAERMAKAQKNLVSNEAELERMLTALGITYGTLEQKWTAFNKAVEEGIIVWDEQEQAYRRVEKAIGDQEQAYKDLVSEIEESSEQILKIRQLEANTLKATIDYEIALEEQKYKEGRISLEEFLTFKERRTREHTDLIIELKERELEALKKQPEEDLVAIKAIEEEIKQIKLRSAQEQLKIRQELTAGLKDEDKNGFNEWKALQDLKLNTMKANSDLQTALDEAAVKAGVLRESTALRNKLDLTRAFLAEQISIVDETAAKQADIYGADSAEYKKALADKEKLQTEYELATISSEAAIAEAKKKEVLEAENFIAEILGDSFRKEEAQRQEKLNQLHKFYAQGLIAAEDYHDALSRLEAQATSTFKKELQERTQQLNQMVDIIRDRTNRMWAAVDGFMKQGYADIKRYFGDAKDALKADIGEVQDEISNFLRAVNSGSYNTFWSATLFGRRMVEMVGTSIYEWAQRITEYIQYVKSLMASLQDTIDSYRLQLAQLRGDRTLETEMWYAQEKKKLEEKYKDDLGKTQEYYEAMALLDQIYAEKKKKLAEETAQEEQRIREDAEARAGASGGLAGSLPTAPDFVQRMKESILDEVANLGALAYEFAAPAMQQTITKEISIKAELDVTTADDAEYVNRLFENRIWPLFERKLRLLGVEL